MINVTQFKQPGIDGYVHNWIENWLINKKQRIANDETPSEWTLELCSRTCL